jgi:hypothetical protein
VEKSICLLKILAVPDYRITLKMKLGPDKVGVRYYPSYDLDHVRWQVHQRILKTIGMFPVAEIIVEMMPEAGVTPEPDKGSENTEG